MEFRFNVNEYFKTPIVEIRNTLLPPDFAGDRRALWNTVNKVAEVINEMGEASAHAQGLNKPITTAERLRQSDQSLYLLVDPEGNNGNGAVTGMLKVGRKGLYVFDREGQHYQVTPPCVLDFYVHEKRQRSGLGKKLFEYMLEKENVKPRNLAIDRPSDKFLNFLNKHYNLQSPVKQMNNYVVFDGFFPEGKKEEQTENSSINRTNGLQSAYSNAPSYGRYGAPRPPCSMGQIIHNTSSQKNTEPASPNVRQENFSDQQYQQQYQPNQQNNTQINYPVQRSYQLPLSVNSNSTQRFANIAAPANPVQNVPQQHTFQEPQGYKTSNSPQTQQINQIPPYQQMYQANPTNNSQRSELLDTTNVVPQNYYRMLPQQNIYDPSHGSPNVPHMMNVPQQNIPQQVQDMTQFHQNQSIMQTPQAEQMASPPQPLQEQRRMFPERELEARRLPYQNVQYAGSVETNRNTMAPSAEYQSQSREQIWPTQVQPQQVYRMSEGVPNVLRSPHSAAVSQTEMAQVMHPQQFVQQVNPHFVQQNQQLQSSVHTPHTSQSALYRQNEQYDGENRNVYSRNVPYQENSGYQNNMPQATEPEVRYVPQQTYLRQPDRTPYNIQKAQPSHMQHTTQQKHGIDPQQQQRRLQQQQDKQKTQGEGKNQFDSETVSSLLQVDPKYFKSEPVQIKQPSETLVTSGTVQRSVKQEETVDSLLRAEQEYFENGQLREKYRIPVRYNVTPTGQQFSPNHHTNEVAETEQGGYPRQMEQRTTKEQVHKHYSMQPQYVPQEIYAQQKQEHSHQMQQLTYPEQARTQFAPQPQYVPQQNYLHQQSQQGPQVVAAQEQTQSPYIPQEQYSPQQFIPQQSYAHYPPQASQQQHIQQEFRRPEPQNAVSDQLQPRQQYHHDQQRYVPVQNVSQERFGAPAQPAMDQQQDATGRRTEFEEYRSKSQTFEEPDGGRNIVQYSVETSGSVPPANLVRVEPQVQRTDELESQTGEGRPTEESVGGQSRLLENVRQSSFIANDFNPHAEGPGRRSPDVKSDGSTEMPIQRKKKVDRQYGLNDVDMKRKAYKSALIKRTTATTPRVNAESVNTSPKLERPKSLEIQMESSVQEPRSEPIEEEGPEVVEVDAGPEDDVEPEIQKLQISDNLASSPSSGKRTPRHLTEQGYFDLKFYHNKLW